MGVEQEMMNQEIKAQWVADLRDPNRKQCKGLLENDEGAQCCLGVLAEQGRRAGIIQPPILMLMDEYDENNEDQEAYVYLSEDGEREYLTLPEAIQRWSGLSESDPHVYYPQGNTKDRAYQGEEGFSLAGLNDSYTKEDGTEGLTFIEIAAIIEADEDL